LGIAETELAPASVFSAFGKHRSDVKVTPGGGVGAARSDTHGRHRAIPNVLHGVISPQVTHMYRVASEPLTARYTHDLMNQPNRK